MHGIFSKLSAFFKLPWRRGYKNEKRFLESSVFCMLTQNRARCTDSAILTAIASCRVRGQEVAEIFSMPEITNMPATRRVHSFSVNEQSYRLDISETWRTRSWNISPLLCVTKSLNVEIVNGELWTLSTI